MRAFLLASLLAACGGPSRNQLAETPTAQTPRTPSLAPPASDDEERYKVNDQFEQQRDADQAHREAGNEGAPPPAPLPGTGSGSGSAAPPAPKK